jgi:glycosyltransferase involved in cell wall biosynthesis
MRILHVVTLVSPTGEYGGPTRVALNQSHALAELGHRTLVAAGQRGFSPIPTVINDVPVRLFPVRRMVPGTGFAGMASPGLLAWLRKAMYSCDVLHIHLARDLITMPVAMLARRLRIPYVVQTHGMIDASDKALARILDSVATRDVLANAAAVFHLNERERSALEDVAGPELCFVELRNGVGAPPTLDSAARDANPLLEVLYLARLHPRKRPMDFVDAAAALLPDYPDVLFRMVGPDEGEGKRVAVAIDQVGSPRLRWDGPVPMEQTASLMAKAGIYVLPSIDEPLAMTVLEAMSQGCPVVVTDSCDLAPLVARSGSGLVTPPGSLSVKSAIEKLLVDPQGRQAMGLAAQLTARKELDMDVVTHTLLSAYAGARQRAGNDAR